MILKSLMSVKALDELKKKAERNIDNLKQYGLVQMSRLDMKKVASPTLTVSIRNSKSYEYQR